VGVLALAVAAAPPAEVGHAMVATDHRLASNAGASVLTAGGNAVDAAVAAALAAGVVQPAGSGLGGGGFAVGVAGGDRWVADFRERAPMAATRDMYLDDAGAIRNGESRSGGLAVAVPGESRGLAQLLASRGSLSPAAVAAPAIALARKGFAVEGLLESALARTEHRDVIALFDFDGRRLRVRDRLTRPDLARTLKRWASTAGEDLHVGSGAAAIVEATTASGGVITAEDLARYAPSSHEPVVVGYRGYTLVTMPPPSSGGVVLGQVLRVLEGYDLAPLGHNSADYVHLLTEVMKHAYADRAHHLGDPEFIEVDVARLVGDERVAEVREKVWPGRTFETAYYGKLMAVPADAGTQHISVIDRAGTAVALTTTINTGFGSGVIAGSTGIILNNQMDDFAAAPGVPNAFGLVGGEANAIEPGKRPLSSMSPTVVLGPDGEVVMVMGASGGSFIISSVLQAFLNVVEFEMDPSEAVAAARFHHQWLPDKLMLESAIPVDVKRALEVRGHEVAVFDQYASVQLVVRSAPKTSGASDPRKGGWPVGVW
jgi:gamma-glutamyltranspeptidase/glutathione hydrolase